MESHYVLKKHNHYMMKLMKLAATSLLLTILVILGLSYHQIIPHFITLSSSQNVTVEQLSIESFNDFQIEMRSTGQPLVSENLTNVQILLTTHAPIQNLHFSWALERDVIVMTSELPEDPISLDFQQTPIEYNVGIRITGPRPYLILHAYTLGTDGEKIGEIAGIYFTQDGNTFLPNINIEGPKIRIDPNKIKVIR